MMRLANRYGFLAVFLTVSDDLAVCNMVCSNIIEIIQLFTIDESMIHMLNTGLPPVDND
jgi:hypothetical protein